MIEGEVRNPLDGAVNDINGTAVVVISDDDSPRYDSDTGTLQIPLPDGTVEIQFGAPPKKDIDTDFDANLAEQLEDSELSMIAERLLLGISNDEQSRDQWLQNMSDGIALLGLEVKNPRGAAASGGTPSEGVSTVDHPLLLEAVLRFQANARGELLPSDGPVKVRNDGEGNSLAAILAEALEKDLNHYLTKVAKEYYPDTDRMLLMLGFCGIAFKKGYHCPIKRRPVIESIAAKDLIVSNAATDIDGAGRVTHRIMMRPSVLRRMQLLGEYRDIHLPSPGTPTQKNAVDAAIDRVQGIAPATYVEPADQDRELYECYCELDIPGFEHKLDGKPTGLPLPYRVTVDVESRQILQIRRQWAEDDPFCLAQNRIVAYLFIPGLGFYGLGLLNVLGNATKAVTAAWRLMIDAGMFANFPGFIYLKSLAKQLTNQFRIPPGGGLPIDTMGGDIRAAVMPLPYKDPSAVFIQLIENIAATAQRVGGTAELQVGEGRQDAPVGTTLALIEQATKLMSAVHKRCHQSQGMEFDMLKDLLAEDPEALWRHNKKSKVLKVLAAQAGQQPLLDAEQAAEDRHRELFLAALADCELVPAADPNTSSMTERYLKCVALRQMAQTNPSIDINKVDELAMRVMGIDDAESYFKPAPPPGAGGPAPEEVMAQATAVAAQARLLDSQTKARQADTQAQIKLRDIASREEVARTNLAKELVIHDVDRRQQDAQQQHEGRHRAADRIHGLALAAIGHRAKAREAAAGRAHGLFADHLDRAHEAAEAARGRAHEAGMAALQQGHEAGMAAQDRAHDLALQGDEGVGP